MLRDIVDFFRVLIAKARRKPVALCDVGDVDGIASAAIFKHAYPDAVIVLRAPAQVQKSRWLRLFTWDFVADLPCPPKSRVLRRADHHRTNPPCAIEECYDPSAPCAAILAAKLLKLEDDPLVRQLVDAAVQTDTANIVSEKVKLLDQAVRYAGYRTKIKIINSLAKYGIDRTLEMEEVKRAIEKAREAEHIINVILEKVPASEIVTIFFPKGKKLGISYRQLNIEIQKRKGSKFINILVKRGYRTYRLYCGADKESRYDCTIIAKTLGGGGHKFAAGAQYKAPILRPGEGFKRFVEVLKQYLKTDKINVIIIDEKLNVKSVET